VAGRRRLEAAIHLGLDKVEVIVLPPEMPSDEAFRLGFWDNAAHRRFDVALAAVVVKRLFELYPLDVISGEFLPALGLAAKGPRLAHLRAVGALERSILQELAAGSIMEKTAAILAEVGNEDRKAVMELINALGTNANTNAEIAGNLFDLSVFHGRRISELLQEQCIREVLEDPDVARPAKASRVREILRSWKFPELVTEEKRFQRWCHELGLPRNVAVRPSQAFETRECTLEIKLKSREHARCLIEKLREDVSFVD